MDQAIKPDVFSEFRDIEVHVEKEEKNPDDVALAALHNHDGWTVLKTYIEDLKKEMDVLVTASISNGSNFEEVGKVAVITNLCKEKLNDIQNRVRDAYDSINGD